jgi:uncharacterized integral membrane protein
MTIIGPREQNKGKLFIYGEKVYVIILYNWGRLAISNECECECEPLKKWPRRDFIWLSIVFLLALIFFTTLALGNSARAGENLNFAATAVSVVLAVIAIVITLWDATGQKQNVMQLKKTTRKLEKSLEDVKAFLVENAETTDRYNKSIQLNEELYEKLIAKFDSDKKIDVKELNEEIRKTKAEQAVNVEHIYPCKLKNNTFYLRMVNQDESLDLSNLRIFIQSMLTISKNMIHLKPIDDSPTDYILVIRSHKIISHLKLNLMLGEYPQKIEVLNSNGNQ